MVELTHDQQLALLRLWSRTKSPVTYWPTSVARDAESEFSSLEQLGLVELSPSIADWVRLTQAGREMASKMMMENA